MASAALTLCPEPGCPNLTKGGPCPPHKKQRELRRGSAHSRGYGVAWRRIRARVLREEPICRRCGKVASREVDHIVPKELGGTDERENLQALCKPCHSTKTYVSDGSFGRPVLQRVIVVCGPPAAGKSTYVANRASVGDLVVDVDRIFEALSGQPYYDKPGALLPFVLAARDAVLSRLERPSPVGRAWIITGGADSRERERLERTFKAHVVVLETSTEECLRRLRQDPRRANRAGEWEPLIRDWWRLYTRRDRGDNVVARAA